MSKNNNVVIAKAISNEIQILTDISKRAFESDKLLGNIDVSGPPNYDSESWHFEMVNKGTLYSVKSEEKIIGGAVIFKDYRNEHIMYLGRLFIDPDYHRLGYGRVSMEIMEKMFPAITLWKLETPVWNERTNRFYQHLKYVEIRRDSQSIYYQKEIIK